MRRRFFFTRTMLFPPQNKRNTHDKAKGLCISSERYIGELGVRCLSPLSRGQDLRQQSPFASHIEVESTSKRLLLLGINIHCCSLVLTTVSHTRTLWQQCCTQQGRVRRRHVHFDAVALEEVPHRSVRVAFRSNSRMIQISSKCVTSSPANIIRFLGNTFCLPLPTTPRDHTCGGMHKYY